MRNCPSETERERHLLGTIAEQASARIDRHRLGCADCRQWFETAVRQDDLLTPLRRAWSEALDVGQDVRRASNAASYHGGERGSDTVADLDASALARYRILGRLGTGGMGIVYEAEQQAPRRRVALKVVRPGYCSKQLLRRFVFEAEVLGRLDHPGIAKIHEAGTFGAAGDRRPFFAMELIRGRPLDEHVAVEGLGIKQRLQLFALICDAVGYAHQNAVIHRDLKPSNILVTPEGAPKILDFGVARVTDVDMQTVTLTTMAGQIVGTLAYMSPEQVGGQRADLDLRSDIYSLGVIYYELLTGQRPHDLTDSSIAEGVRVIREDDPRPMGQLVPALRGDLETIGRKALEKSPDQRYASVSALGDDVKRFLRHEPIAARSPTLIYQLGRYSRQHRALVGGTFAALLALSIGGVAYAVQSSHTTAAHVEAVAEALRAEAEAANARGLSDFLVDVLVLTSPDSTLNLSIDEVFDRSVARIDREYAAEPLVRAELHHTVALTILRVRAMGFELLTKDSLDEAEHHLRQAREIWEEHYSQEHAKVALVLEELAWVESERGTAGQAADRKHKAPPP